MSIQGSPYARFRRALATGNPLLVRGAAAELPRVELADALAICLVLLRAEPTRYPRAATRWHGRLCLEVPGLELAEAELVLGALRALREPGGAVGQATLLAVCEAHGLDRVAAALAEWAPR